MLRCAAINARCEMKRHVSRQCLPTFALMMLVLGSPQDTRADVTGWATSWHRMGASFAGNPAVAAAADGRLEVFLRGADNVLYHIWQTAPNGDWSQWENLSSGTYRPLGHPVAGDPGVGSAADGRLEVFVRGADNVLYHIWQTA